MSNAKPEETDLVLQPTDSGEAPVLPLAMIKALQKAGVQPHAVTVPDVPIYIPMEMDALCARPSRYRDAIGESPLMTITSVDEFPDADEFEGYQGFFRAEAVTEDGEYIAWSSHMINRETGEAGPLYAYVRDGVAPFLMRIVVVRTRKEGRKVYRPIPV